jgi:hypothetical protein
MAFAFLLKIPLLYDMDIDSCVSGKKWVAPASCSPEHQPQSVASAALDRSAMDGLVSRAGKRDVQLRRLDVDHANAWISVLPSSMDGIR